MADEVDGAGDRRLGASTSSAATEGVTSKQRKTRLCPHCSDVVSRASYFRHKRDFYDYRTKQWATDTVNTCRTEVEVGGDSTPPLDDGRRDLDHTPYTYMHDKFLAVNLSIGFCMGSALPLLV